MGKQSALRVGCHPKSLLWKISMYEKSGTLKYDMYKYVAKEKPSPMHWRKKKVVFTF